MSAKQSSLKYSCSFCAGQSARSYTVSFVPAKSRVLTPRDCYRHYQRELTQYAPKRAHLHRSGKSREGVSGSHSPTGNGGKGSTLSRLSRLTGGNAGQAACCAVRHDVALLESRRTKFRLGPVRASHLAPQVAVGCGVDVAGAAYVSQRSPCRAVTWRRHLCEAVRVVMLCACASFVTEGPRLRIEFGQLKSRSLQRPCHCFSSFAQSQSPT